MSEELTRRSLLVRVRDVADAAAWAAFEDRYRELILRYARARRLQATDAEDICQLVMAKLARSLRNFEYDPARGRFRGYLHRIVRNEIIQQFARPNRADTPVAHDVLAAQAAGADAETDAAWEREWENHHLRIAMRTIRESFDARSVAVFERLLAGDGIAETAASFDLSTQAVHKIKQRIRGRLQTLIAAQVREEDQPDAPIGG